MSEHHASASLARQGRLTMKEFRETLRDRRTIGTLLLMPILVYPLLSITFQRLMLPGLEEAEQRPTYLVVVQRVEDAEIFHQRLEAARRLESPEQLQRFPLHELRLVDDVADAVATGIASIGIRFRDPQRPGRSGVLEVVYRPESGGWQALAAFESRLRAVNEDWLRRELGSFEDDASLPARVERIEVQPREELSPLTTLVPLILILMTITGAVYPAIDLTAGERERGTLETLMASPASRLALLLAKYAAVVAVAVLTATINLTAMTVTIYVSGLGPVLFGKAGLSLLSVAQVFGLLILFATFFAAILLSITSVARSFKEAQAYLIPLMLVSIAPGLLSLMPGVALSTGLASVPLVNIVLLARDTFQGEAQLGVAVLAVVTTALYSLAAIGLAARVFGGDAMLYGSARSWSDIFRRGATSAPATSAGTAALAAALLIPAQFVLGGISSRAASTIVMRLVLSAAATAMLFGGLPWLVARFQGIRPRTALRLYRPRFAAWPAALLLGISLWPLAHEVYQLGIWLGLASINEEQLARARELLEQWQRVPLALIVITIGVAPGVCEELFFRGLLFSAWRQRLSAVATVLATAILFAVFHLITPTVLATERLLPSAFLGLVLGWVSLRTGSILPSMLVHVVHNSLLLTMTRWLKPGDDWMPGNLGALHLPAHWILAGVVGTLAGFAFVELAKPREQRAVDASRAVSE